MDERGVERLMASELKEQKQRFEDLLRWVELPCTICPAKEVCYPKGIATTAEVTVTCEDTWWHYIQTGEILI